MKTKPKKHQDIYGRTYTKFGYALHTILSVAAFITFFLLLGFTGSCELGDITVHQYIMRIIPCGAVFVGCILIHNRVFEGRW